MPGTRKVVVAVLLAVIAGGQYNGVGISRSVATADPTLAQAVYEIWSMIALCALLLIAEREADRRAGVANVATPPGES